MADSSITKKALASALKDLMKEQSFSSISVANISERCEMNRKSFYYHFKDKYDLVNWIFDTEFIAVGSQSETVSSWDLLQKLADYLYENHEFYRAAMRIEGQNSFKEHFREIVAAMAEHELKKIFVGSEINDFQILFLTDGFASAFERWILEKECMTSAEFLTLTWELIAGLADKVQKDMKEARN